MHSGNSDNASFLRHLLENPKHTFFTPLHDKTQMTYLELLMAVMKLYSRYDVSEEGISEVLKLVSAVLGSVAKPDTLPQTFDQFNNLCKDLLIHHVDYQYCPCSQTLYSEEECIEKCPSCNRPKSDAKSFYYMPLIPRLKQLYAVPYYAKQMTSWATNTYMYSDVYDGSVWDGLYNAQESKFQKNPGALSLIISSDGTQPFHHVPRNGSYTTWLFSSVLANLPHFLREHLVLINGLTEGM